MKNVNKVILLGNLGTDPLSRKTKTGTSVVHLSLATSRKIPQENRSDSPDALPSFTEETQWHQVVVWGKQGDVCAQYLKKGSQIYVEGSLRSHTYEDREKHKKTSFEVYADQVIFLGAKNNQPAVIQA